MGKLLVACRQCNSMAQMTVPNEVKQRANELAADKDMTMKEAIRLMVREGGYDV